jgi:hypothetical protein
MAPRTAFDSVWRVHFAEIAPDERSWLYEMNAAWISPAAGIST